jgi:hypothetical protein
MDRLALILAVCLSVYAALAGLTWLQRLIGERMAARKRGMALNLARRAGPPVAGGLVVLVAGTVLRLPGHLPLAAILIGGGLAFGLHRGLSDVRQGDKRSIGFRLAVTLGLSLAILWQAGVI